MAIQPTIPNTPPQPDQRPKRGTGFTNINRILEANKSNKLGQAVSSGLQAGTGQFQMGLGGAQGQFQKEAGEGDLGSQANVEARRAALERIQSGANTAVNEQDVQKFAKFRGGQYTGPQELDPTKVTALSKQAQELGGLGESLRGGDKQAVLKAFAGRGPQYSQGQQKIDTLLLGQSPNKNLLAQARRGTVGLEGQLARGQETAREQAQTLQGGAQKFGEETKAQLAGAYQPLSSDLDKQVTEAQQKNQQMQSDFQTVQNLFARSGNIQETVGPQGKGTSLIGVPNIQELASTSPEFQRLVQAAGITPQQLQGLQSNINSTQQKWSQLDQQEKALPGQMEQEKSQLRAQFYQAYNPARGFDPEQMLNQYISQKYSPIQQQVSNAKKAELQKINSAIPSLLSKSFDFTGAQNVSREGLADQTRSAQLNALSRLSGQTQEFTQPTGTYTQPGVKFNPLDFNLDPANVAQAPIRY